MLLTIIYGSYRLRIIQRYLGVGSPFNQGEKWRVRDMPMLGGISNSVVWDSQLTEGLTLQHVQELIAVEGPLIVQWAGIMVSAF